MSSKSMDLEVFASFKASHSLAGFEIPHFHFWKISVCFTIPFPMPADRVLDLVYLQEQLSKIITPITGAYLNECGAHSPLLMSPTSENMAVFISEQVAKMIPEVAQQKVILKFVQVTLCDLEGNAMGRATLREPLA